MVCFLVMHGWLLISMQATLFYSRTFGEDFVIVNSEKIARILADQRSTIYSNRPHSPLYWMWASLVTFARSPHHRIPYSFGTSHMTPVLQYGDEWKMHRKLLHPSLRHEAVDRYQDLHLSNAHRLLENMRHDSANFCEHFDQYVLRFPLWVFLRLAVTPVRPLLSLHTAAR